MSFRDTVALKGKLTITLNGTIVQEIKNLVEFSGCIAEYINSEITEYIEFENMVKFLYFHFYFTFIL